MPQRNDFLHVISLEQARDAGLYRYFTGLPCKSGHFASRRTSGRSCSACDRERYERNFEKDSVRRKKHYEENKESMLANNREYARKNKETISARNKKQYPDKREKKLAYLAQWRKENPDYDRIRREKRRPQHNEAAARYRASVRARTIPLSDKMKEDMVHLYEQQQMLKHLGYDYHVDHIIPLHGETVSGLHVPWNLRLIPAKENRLKSNQLVHELIESK